MKWSAKTKFCDVRTNSLKQYHKECMKNSVEKMHVDAGAKGLIEIKNLINNLFGLNLQ